jgi:hypothetical protein
LVVEAAKNEFSVWQTDKLIKRVAIKGLYKRVLSLEDYRVCIAKEARSEQRGWQAKLD